MGKDKYRRFQENLTFANMVQPDFEEVFGRSTGSRGIGTMSFSVIRIR